MVCRPEAALFYGVPIGELSKYSTPEDALEKAGFLEDIGYVNYCRTSDGFGYGPKRGTGYLYAAELTKCTKSNTVTPIDLDVPRSPDDEYRDLLVKGVKALKESDSDRLFDDVNVDPSELDPQWYLIPLVRLHSTGSIRELSGHF